MTWISRLYAPGIAAGYGGTIGIASTYRRWVVLSVAVVP